MQGEVVVVESPICLSGADKFADGAVLQIAEARAERCRPHHDIRGAAVKTNVIDRILKIDDDIGEFDAQLSSGDDSSRRKPVAIARDASKIG